MALMNYKLVEDEGVSDQFLVRIEDGEWAGTLFSYGQVKMAPPKDKTWEDLQEGVDCEPVLTYTIEVLEANGDVAELEQNQSFLDSTGDILVDIIQDAFDNDKYSIGDKDAGESGNDDPS